MKREREMAELRVLLSQEVRSPTPHLSSALPTAGAITQSQLTTSREQDLQALRVAQQTIADLRVRALSVHSFTHTHTWTYVHTYVYTYRQVHIYSQPNVRTYSTYVICTRYVHAVYVGSS